MSPSVHTVARSLCSPDRRDSSDEFSSSAHEAGEGEGGWVSERDLSLKERDWVSERDLLSKIMPVNI